MRFLLCMYPGITEIHAVRTRRVGAGVCVDLHMLVPPDMSVRRSHELADLVEAHVMDSERDVYDVMVHVEPDTPPRRGEPGHRE